MSSFAMGFGRHTFVPHQFVARNQHNIARSRLISQATRSFHISTSLRAAQQTAPKKQKPKVTTIAPSPPPSPVPTTIHSVVTLSIAEKLAQRGKPTMLYEAPSHFWLRVSSLSASVFCMSYVGIQYYSVVAFPPEGLAWWVPHLFVPIILVMGAAGGWFALGTAHIIRSIQAVPKSMLPKSYLTGGKAKKTKEEEKSLIALNASPVALDITLSNVLPFLPPKRIITAPEEVLLPFKMQSTPVAMGITAEAPAPKATGGVMDTIAAPFAAIGRAFRGPFSGLRRGLLREGFAKIKVKDKNYKIDITGGKLLDQGKVLDHIVAYRPNRFSRVPQMW
ncbi:hypothetical protein VM1G_00985 [Cytospora mali]|uniref:Uncharacterized protein n=1 Tax=Cytospora mali TaxID=578113 RepID=A0A194VM41_CYTMA|nr:hypothetical protein VM1G_00985 [Valsa mali]